MLQLTLIKCFFLLELSLVKLHSIHKVSSWFEFNLFRSFLKFGYRCIGAIIITPPPCSFSLDSRSQRKLLKSFSLSCHNFLSSLSFNHVSEKTKNVLLPRQFILNNFKCVDFLVFYIMKFVFGQRSRVYFDIPRSQDKRLV